MQQLTQTIDRASHIKFTQSLTPKGANEFGNIDREKRLIQIQRRVPDPSNQPGQALLIALGNRNQHLLNGLSQVLINPPHHAKIENT